MRRFVVRPLHIFTALVAVAFALTMALTQQKSATEKKSGKTVSFKTDVFSKIIKKYCLPCHAEDQFNPSELSMDTYDQLKTGGKHGAPWVAGKSKESLIVQKLGSNPPFDDRMPLNDKKKIAAGKAKYLSDQEIKMIVTWIDQGAKNN